MVRKVASHGGWAWRERAINHPPSRNSFWAQQATIEWRYEPGRGRGGGRREQLVVGARHTAHFMEM